jgi:hypothetical protein
MGWTWLLIKPMSWWTHDPAASVVTFENLASHATPGLWLVTAKPTYRGTLMVMLEEVPNSVHVLPSAE